MASAEDLIEQIKNSTDTFAIQWIHTFLGAGT